MKNTLLLFTILLSSLSFAQTKFTVTVANFSFTPANITISVGDTVEFVNSSGTHWIDGRQSTFPSNPASFDNQSQSGTGWTYIQVFNTAGMYDYRCGIHTSTMSGTIDVQTAAGITNAQVKKALDFYPNPASKTLYFSEYEKINDISIYSLTGEKLFQSIITKDEMDVSVLNPGIYFVKLNTENGEITKKLIIQ